ncbi:gluconokinase [Agromyces atrinae]|uniref:gluconokinase n=1 Tax=Agromyces atrinae TaxID=592376 RepID=UPI001F586DDC|nr:gluconokinase [Agromyces atrinae]MCI2959352.1 gluconokinase [Agromyces atrinae]
MNTVPRLPLIVMGVSGSGKSTIGQSLADAFGREFIDGDDLHPTANKQKMAAGHALNDEDRAPWLEIIAQRIGSELAEGQPIVVACSALKRRYRDQLVSHAPETVFVHLVGERDVIAERQSHRTHEYMPTSLLDSQFATLEPLDDAENGFVVDVTLTPEQIVAAVRDELGTPHAG